MRVLCIGECMAELSPSDTPGQFTLGFAGDTFNTAWYLRHLRPDIATAYLSAVGTDTLSDQMLETAVAAGIGTRHIARLPDRTLGLYLISLAAGERSFSYWRGQSAARHLADDSARLLTALEEADTIYFSGITLAILTPEARMRLLSALKAARAAGKAIVFDPNLRPRLWSDVAEMCDAIMAGAAVGTILLPSFEDEASHFGDPDPEGTIARYVAAGAQCVIVKNGAGSVYFSQAGETGAVAVPEVAQPVDTTAAGDSFNGAILAQLDRGRPLDTMIAVAAGVAGQVVCGKGALVPLNLGRIAV